MESTFIIKKEDFNSDFVEAVKKLFSKSRQLQITINTSEDFDLLKAETPEEYLERLKKVIGEVDKKKNLIKISDSELDEMVLSRI
ncbi:MAG: hypothetical protein ACTHNG_17340 [Ginsengibacter sp.]|jgi:hypothetical protein